MGVRVTGVGGAEHLPARMVRRHLQEGRAGGGEPGRTTVWCTSSGITASAQSPSTW